MTESVVPPTAGMSEELQRLLDRERELQGPRERWIEGRRLLDEWIVRNTDIVIWAKGHSYLPQGHPLIPTPGRYPAYLIRGGGWREPSLIVAPVENTQWGICFTPLSTFQPDTPLADIIRGVHAERNDPCQTVAVPHT